MSASGARARAHAAGCRMSPLQLQQPGAQLESKVAAAAGLPPAPPRCSHAPVLLPPPPPPSLLLPVLLPLPPPATWLLLAAARSMSHSWAPSRRATWAQTWPGARRASGRQAGSSTAAAQRHRCGPRTPRTHARRRTCCGCRVAVRVTAAALGRCCLLAACLPVAQVPSAHRGFLARARAVPVEALAELAAASGRRLVLCGHSLVRAGRREGAPAVARMLLLLSHPRVASPATTPATTACQGGAVAKLAGLRLLRGAPAWPPPDLRVICFATPAVGNDALAALVEAAGWGRHFTSYALPGAGARASRGRGGHVPHACAACGQCVARSLTVLLARCIAHRDTLPAAEDQLMRMLRFTQAVPGSSSSSRADSPGGSPAGTALTTAGQQGSSSSSAGSASAPQLSASQHPVLLLASLLLRPFTQESAQQQLRRELSGAAPCFQDDGSMRGRGCACSSDPCGCIQHTRVLPAHLCFVAAAVDALQPRKRPRPRRMLAAWTLTQQQQQTSRR